MCFTPAATQASIMLLSNCTRSGIGEQTRKTSSTSRSAAARVSFFAKSAIAVGVPVGALAASCAERYIAVCCAPLRATSFSTALPTVPLAPVTRIIVRSPKSNLPRLRKRYSLKPPPTFARQWYKYGESAGSTHNFVSPGVQYERQSWVSGTGHNQRSKRKVESFGGVAFGIWSEALCRVA